MPVLILSILIVILIIALAFAIIVNVYKNTTIKDIKNKIYLISSEKTNNLVNCNSKNKNMIDLVNAINANMKCINDLKTKITIEENKLVGTITNLSHDLRTPITSVLGYSQLLRKSELTSKQEEYVKIIEARIITLKEIVEELYEYSLTYETKELSYERIDIKSLLENTVLMFYNDFETKGFKVEINLTDGKVERIVDSFELKRVYMNIIGNALKYGKDLFSINYVNEEFVFSNRIVSMDQIDVERLFDRFFTVAKSRTTGSTGLGLSISKRIIEKMGGKISAKLDDDILSIKLKL